MQDGWVYDIEEMHEKFGTTEWVLDKLAKKDYEALRDLLEFRIACIQEEVNELKDASENEDSEEIVDALIDIIVFSIGTLDLFAINPHLAWKAVHNANISKSVGVKEGRPNPLGLPDLIKPADWQPPNHEHNHGILPLIFGKK